ncbi:mechanosensitive ion channel family protein [Conexibacter sp. SYSU D00693]|uniref:mechanosensitive ion channel family protein n=1 Tax=Conexibacter sp. SYSU D00693 TaxID=2812560 RepID=UPI00196B839E|nr:mechanosensitive ion channel family protein [Conexibacter sp. SYSU D00693]
MERIALPAADITPLDDLDVWIRGELLEIVLLILGSVLLGRFIGWFRDRLLRRIAEGQDEDALVRSETSKHRRAVVQILAWSAVVLMWTITAALVVHRFGIPFASLAAPLAAGGVALGLGAQRLVSDLIGGGFIIAERQYGVGDLIDIAPTPNTAGATGTVEDVTLRITRLRTAGGERVIIPNGQIVQVTNLSSDWARAVVDVPLQLGTDLGQATELLREVGAAAYADDEVRQLLLDEPSVMGVERFEADEVTLRVVARTLPGKQFEVARLLRVRIAQALQQAGMSSSPDSAAGTPTADA